MKEQISTAYWHEKLKQLGIIVIIPSYNNGKTLADVIEVYVSTPPISLLSTTGLQMKLPEYLAGNLTYIPSPTLPIKEKE